jgi:hypothetical protein
MAWQVWARAPDITIDALRAAANALDALPDWPDQATGRLQYLCVTHGLSQRYPRSRSGSCALAYDFLQPDPASLFHPPAANPPRANENTAVAMQRLIPAVRAAHYRTTHYQNRRAQSRRTSLLIQASAARAANKH